MRVWSEKRGQMQKDGYYMGKTYAVLHPPTLEEYKADWLPTFDIPDEYDHYVYSQAFRVGYYSSISDQIRGKEQTKIIEGLAKKLAKNIYILDALEERTIEMASTPTKRKPLKKQAEDEIVSKKSRNYHDADLDDYEEEEDAREEEENPKRKGKIRSLPSKKEKKKKVQYVNEVAFSGNLGTDAELAGNKKHTCLKFRLAVWQPGEDNDTMWFNVVTWDEDMCEEYADLEKGERIIVRGHLNMNTYKGKRYYGILATEIERG